MSAANDHIDLRSVPKRLLLFVNLFDGCLQGGSLQVHTDICQVISGVVNREPNFGEVPTKSGSGTSGMSFSFFPLTVMTRNFSAWVQFDLMARIARGCKM